MTELRATDAARTPETRAKSRIVAAVGLVIALVGALNGTLFYCRDHRELAALCIGVSILDLAAAVLAHRTRWHVAPGALIAATFLLGAAGGSLLEGGPPGVLSASGLLFPILVPQIVTYLLGVRSGIAMGLATLGYLTVALAWVLLHPTGAGDPLLVTKCVGAGVALVVGLSVSILYTRARARTVAKLRATHGALDAMRVVEQRRLREETDLAARIQTALLPHDLDVEGLEISAAMLSAAHAEGVGGDYYDVVPVEGGAWLCIGDVAGHGLHAGLTMLMIQSTVSALVQDDPALSPGEALSALNTVVYQNVRQRMGRDEHATLTLLRYRRDGTVCFAGAHEDILVFRAAEGRCETVATPGPWIGARPSVEGQVPVNQLRLAEGDVLVLYTNGLTEARDGGRRELGLSRVEAEIVRRRDEPVEAIREAILGALHAFCPVLADDVALVVARYRAPASGKSVRKKE